MQIFKFQQYAGYIGAYRCGVSEYATPTYILNLVSSLCYHCSPASIVNHF